MADDRGEVRTNVMMIKHWEGRRRRTSDHPGYSAPHNRPTVSCLLIGVEGSRDFSVVRLPTCY